MQLECLYIYAANCDQNIPLFLNSSLSRNLASIWLPNTIFVPALSLAFVTGDIFMPWNIIPLLHHGSSTTQVSILL